MEVSLAFQLSPTICTIIDSNDKFPVRRILCVGANYVAHAIEENLHFSLLNQLMLL